MFIDTHIHENKYSSDSRVPLSGFLELVRRVGLAASFLDSGFTLLDYVRAS